jgi:hypothetical protein
LLTDLYELNMVASYLRRSMTGQATFSLFVRALPPGRGFLIAAGLADCLQFLEDFSFTPDDLDYLRQARGFGEDTLRGFAGLRFTGDVRAVPESRVGLKLPLTAAAQPPAPSGRWRRFPELTGGVPHRGGSSRMARVFRPYHARGILPTMCRTAVHRTLGSEQTADQEAALYRHGVIWLETATRRMP